MQYLEQDGRSRERQAGHPKSVCIMQKIMINYSNSLFRLWTTDVSVMIKDTVAVLLDLCLTVEVSM